MKEQTALLIAAVPKLAPRLYRFAYCLSQNALEAQKLLLHAMKHAGIKITETDPSQIETQYLELSLRALYAEILENSNYKNDAENIFSLLTIEQRASIFLQIQLGFKIDIIALILNLSKNEVSSLLIQARRKLKTIEILKRTHNVIPFPGKK